MRLPEVSFILCTRDRPGALLRALRSVRRAAEACPELAAEILVIENGSRPRLRLSDAAVARLGGGRARLIRVEAGGLSAARNIGLAAARGAILAFTDDDCRLDRGWMGDLARHLAAFGRRGLFLGGRVVIGVAADLPFTIRDAAEAATYDARQHPGGFIPGCNFVLSRDVVERVGPFDTSLGAGAPLRAGEDTDYAIRAHLAGIALRYVPDMRVRHHHGRREITAIERLNHAYSFANGALYLRYWNEGWLRRHLFWTLRAAVAEAFGGPPFDPVLGLRWRSVAAGNLAGLLAQLRHPPRTAALRVPAVAKLDETRP